MYVERCICVYRDVHISISTVSNLRDFLLAVSRRNIIFSGICVRAWLQPFVCMYELRS